MPQPDEDLTTSKAAQILSVSPATLVTYAERGLVPYWKLPSGHRRFRRADIERIKRERSVEAS